MGNYFKTAIKQFKEASFERRLLLINSLCLFVPFYIFGARELLASIGLPILTTSLFTAIGFPYLFTVSAVIVRKDIRKETFSVSHWKPLLAFSVLGLVAAAVHGNLAGVGGGLFLITLVIFGFFARAYMTDDIWERITENICVMSVLSFVIGLVDYIVRYDPGSEHRTASTFLNANYYALIVEIVVVLCVYKITKYPKLWYKYLFIAILNCSAVLFCKTRAALAVILIGVLSYFVFAKKKKVIAAVGVVVAALAVATIIAPEVLLPRYESLEWSLNDRFEIWGTAIKNLFRRPIFGGGLWSYWQIVERYGGREAVNAHCIWLDTFLSFGVVGTSLVFYYFTRTLLSIRKEVKEKPLRSAALLALVTAVLAHCTIDLAITGIETSIMAMLIYGIVGNKKEENATE